MRKILTYAVSALALASCSSDSLVSDSPANTQSPIAFNVGQKNITRAQNLEEAGYNDFGVWAYKVKNGEPSSSALVMGNYQVGHTTEGTSTVWYYEGLGDASNKQVMRYWDYSTDKTDFYAYAPYAKATQFDETNKTITVSSTAGYAATNDVIYAGTSVAKENYNIKVQLNFKHIGAKVNIAFRENVAGYKVQLINISDESGFEMTPAIRNGESPNYSYTKTDAKYNKTSSVVINYKSPDSPTTTASAIETSSDNLKFAVPTTGLTEYTAKDANSTKYNVLPEVPAQGTGTYVASPTTYYAVVQPSNTTTGFTLHVSYKLIAEDNGEEIIVRDARVFIPADQVKWESNKAYTYNFTITTASTGSTGGTVDVTSPEVPTDKALLPIVFDQPIIVEYENANAVDSNI